ncbi:MAG: hypothetical protein C0629_11225 [Chromatiales bacterium]|nr:MAG: hypothetical protein C0629_11225 [Chromatiales bacterium]
MTGMQRRPTRSVTRAAAAVWVCWALRCYSWRVYAASLFTETVTMSNNSNDIAGLHREFSRFDSDNNGRIEYEEFIELLGSVGPRPTEEEAQLAFSVIDSDNTGYVEFEEFVHWWLDH